MAGHVFISHGSENIDEATALCALIEGKGVTAWMAPRDVRPGLDYSEALQAAIEGCTAFVVLVTETANVSPYVRAETEMAFSNAKPIFPVRLSDIKPAPGLAFFLKIRHWTDAFGAGREASLERLAAELQSLCGVPASVAAAPSPVAHPAPAPPPAPSPAPGADDELLAAAVGTNAEYFLPRWRRMAEAGRIADWNWAACFANMFWFAFRKMWTPLLLFVLAAFLISAIELFAPGTGMIQWLLFIGLSFITGYFGNHWYRQQSERLVAEVASLDRAAALDQLRRRGGISLRGLFITIGAVALLFALVVVLAVVAAIRSMPAPATAPADSNAAASAPAAAPSPPVMNADYLVGRWTDEGNCDAAHEFTADGRFIAADGGSGTWVLEGDQLTASGPGGSATVRVAAIDQNTMSGATPDGQTGTSTRC